MEQPSVRIAEKPMCVELTPDVEEIDPSVVHENDRKTLQLLRTMCPLVKTKLIVGLIASIPSSRQRLMFAEEFQPRPYAPSASVQRRIEQIRNHPQKSQMQKDLELHEIQTKCRSQESRHRKRDECRISRHAEQLKLLHDAYKHADVENAVTHQTALERDRIVETMHRLAKAFSALGVDREPIVDFMLGQLDAKGQTMLRRHVHGARRYVRSGKYKREVMEAKRKWWFNRHRHRRTGKYKMAYRTDLRPKQFNHEYSNYIDNLQQLQSLGTMHTQADNPCVLGPAVEGELLINNELAVENELVIDNGLAVEGEHAIKREPDDLEEGVEGCETGSQAFGALVHE